MANTKLTLVAQFDDLMRCARGLQNDPSDIFLKFAINQENCRLKWLEAVNEAKRLQIELNKATQICSGLEMKLCHARRLVDQEQKAKRKAEEERDGFIEQIEIIKDLLFSDCRNKLADETREKLANIQSLSYNQSRRDTNTKGGRLNTINELNSTGSLLSELSYSRSEDDLDVTGKQIPGRAWKSRPPPTTDDEPVKSKKRRSSTNEVIEINANDQVVATTRLSFAKDGPVTATSIIEAIPISLKKVPVLTSVPSAEMLAKHNIREECRQHVFHTKATLRPEACNVCGKRIGFAKIVLRCRYCHASVHNDCQHSLKLPCVPTSNTPNTGVTMGSIADYAPSTPPMIPSIIVHSVNEIEQRGLKEIGLYRINGSEKEVKSLKESFLKGKGVPNLSKIDIAVICCTLKNFLRSLREPLITNLLWADFTRAVDQENPNDIQSALCQAVADLPRPNRDTLAFLMLHLQKVAASEECKMPIKNLAKIFAVTLVGYSTANPDAPTMLSETILQTKVVEHLLQLSSDYWSSFINLKTIATPKSSSSDLRTSESQQTPVRNYYFNSNGNSRSTVKKRRFFPTPPNRK